jgi:hypothetical protein
MNTQACPTRIRCQTIGRIVAIVLGVCGVVGVVAGLPAATDVGPVVSKHDGPRTKAPRPKCEECGVVASTREIDRLAVDRGATVPSMVMSGRRNDLAMASVKQYEVTVRMKDGSSRVFTDVNPSRWRAGERVILIEGASHSDN